MIENIPLLAVITAIAFAIVMLIKHWKDIKAAALDAWHWILQATKDVWNWIKGHWPLLLAILTGPFTGGISLIVYLFRQQLQPAITAVVDFIKGAWNWIKGAVGWLTDALTRPFHMMVDAINAALGPLRTLMNAVQSLASLATSAFGGGGVSSAGGWAANITSATSGLPGVSGHRASGGPATQSGVYEVGESGRELVYLPRGSYVQPNSEGRKPSDAGHTVLEAHLYNVIDGRVASRSIVRQGLMATARRGAGGAVLADAG